LTDWTCPAKERQSPNPSAFKQSALEALPEEARKQTISLNTLVNQLLVGYSEVARYVKQMHGLALTGQTFVEILKWLPEDKMIEIGGAAGKNAPVAIITSKHGRMSVNGIEYLHFEHIEYLHFLSAYANLFEYSEAEETGHWTITLTHELGRKWSLFFATIGMKSKYTVSDSSTAFLV